MAFLDKLTDLASTASNKANNAIESGKLNLRINNEEKKIADYTINIGQLIVDKLDAGETFDDEIMALFSSIQASRDVIAIARADLEANKQSPADQASAPVVCAACGTSLDPKDKFCSNCGVKIETTVTPPAADNTVCTNCGAPLAPGTHFCSQCGVKTDN